jgi:hypothetical protein
VSPMPNSPRLRRRRPLRSENNYENGGVKRLRRFCTERSPSPSPAQRSFPRSNATVREGRTWISARARETAHILSKGDLVLSCGLLTSQAITSYIMGFRFEHCARGESRAVCLWESGIDIERATGRLAPPPPLTLKLSWILSSAFSQANLSFKLS